MIREHFNKDGSPKVKWAEEEAKWFAFDHDLAYYECKFCGFWHVGTKKEKNLPPPRKPGGRRFRRKK